LVMCSSTLSPVKPTHVGDSVHCSWQFAFFFFGGGEEKSQIAVFFLNARTNRACAGDGV
jgi:hypothetical protein